MHCTLALQSYHWFLCRHALRGDTCQGRLVDNKWTGSTLPGTSLYTPLNEAAKLDASPACWAMYRGPHSWEYKAWYLRFGMVAQGGDDPQNCLAPKDGAVGDAAHCDITSANLHWCQPIPYVISPHDPNGFCAPTQVQYVEDQPGAVMNMLTVTVPILQVDFIQVYGNKLFKLIFYGDAGCTRSIGNSLGDLAITVTDKMARYSVVSVDDSAHTPGEQIFSKPWAACVLPVLLWSPVVNSGFI